MIFLNAVLRCRKQSGEPMQRLPATLLLSYGTVDTATMCGSDYSPSLPRTATASSPRRLKHCGKGMNLSTRIRPSQKGASSSVRLCFFSASVANAVIDTCSKYGVKLVYASSSTANQDNTTSMYGLSKRFCEQYASIYNHNATGIRFHNVYGKEPRQGTLLAHCLSNKPVTLYNNGNNVRHFTYIGDIVEAAYYAMFSDQRILNACNPEQTTVLKFVEAVSRHRAVDYECVSKLRNFDCIEQDVDVQIYNVPLQYTSVADGLMKVFS